MTDVNVPHDAQSSATLPNWLLNDNVRALMQAADDLYDRSWNHFTIKLPFGALSNSNTGKNFFTLNPPFKFEITGAQAFMRGASDDQTGTLTCSNSDWETMTLASVDGGDTSYYTLDERAQAVNVVDGVNLTFTINADAGSTLLSDGIDDCYVLLHCRHNCMRTITSRPTPPQFKGGDTDIHTQLNTFFTNFATYVSDLSTQNAKRWRIDVVDLLGAGVTSVAAAVTSSTEGYNRFVPPGGRNLNTYDLNLCTSGTGNVTLDIYDEEAAATMGGKTIAGNGSDSAQGLDQGNVPSVAAQGGTAHNDGLVSVRFTAVAGAGTIYRCYAVLYWDE